MPEGMIPGERPLSTVPVFIIILDHLNLDCATDKRVACAERRPLLRRYQCARAAADRGTSCRQSMQAAGGSPPMQSAPA